MSATLTGGAATVGMAMYRFPVLELPIIFTKLGVADIANVLVSISEIGVRQ